MIAEPTPSTAGDDDDDVQRFFFVHVPKTAGTALFVRLRHHFGNRGVYPLPEYEFQLETSIGIDLMLERFEQHRHELRVITGHFPLCAADMLEVPVTTFTVLRDPVERVLSFLRQQQRDEPRYAGMPLEHIYDDEVLRWSLLTNYALRQLSIEEREFTEGPQWTDEERLDRAKIRLLERVDVVGVQEDFEGFCDVLNTRYGWDLGEPVKRNVTEEIETPSSLRERIAEDNRLGLDLYRFAADLWTSRTGRTVDH